MTIWQSLKSKLQYFWANHIQKTFGTIASVLSGIDLVSAMTGNDAYVIKLVGEKWNAAIHLIATVVITLRASMHKKAP